MGVEPPTGMIATTSTVSSLGGWCVLFDGLHCFLRTSLVWCCVSYAFGVVFEFGGLFWAGFKSVCARSAVS